MHTHSHIHTFTHSHILTCTRSHILMHAHTRRKTETNRTPFTTRCELTAMGKKKSSKKKGVTLMPASLGTPGGGPVEHMHARTHKHTHVSHTTTHTHTHTKVSHTCVTHTHTHTHTHTDAEKVVTDQVGNAPFAASPRVLPAPPNYLPPPTATPTRPTTATDVRPAIPPLPQATTPLKRTASPRPADAPKAMDDAFTTPAKAKAKTTVSWTREEALENEIMMRSRMSS